MLSLFEGPSGTAHIEGARIHPELLTDLMGAAQSFMGLFRADLIVRGQDGQVPPPSDEALPLAARSGEKTRAAGDLLLNIKTPLGFTMSSHY